MRQVLRTWLDLNLVWGAARCHLVQSERLCRPLILGDLLLIYRLLAHWILLPLVVTAIGHLALLSGVFGLGDAGVQLVRLVQVELRQI